MADENQTVQYTEKGDDDKITILEDGFFTPQNLKLFEITFAKGHDITDSLEKNKGANSEPVSSKPKGRTAYTPLTCTYPDSTSSSKIVFTNCIVQYIEGVNKKNSTYAENYAFIGFPDIYLGKISSDAKSNSSININNKDTESSMSGYTWIRCNLGKLTKDCCTILVEIDNDPRQVPINLREALQKLKAHIVCDVTATITGSMTTASLAEHPDVTSGQYFFSIKPTQVMLKNTSNVSAPTLTVVNSSKESSEMSPSSVASAEVAKLAMSMLSINGR